MIDTEIDTDGLLDRCAQCGARARSTHYYQDGYPGHGAECTECANTVGPYATKLRAMVAWNATQRAILEGSQ